LSAKAVSQRPNLPLSAAIIKADVAFL